MSAFKVESLGHLGHLDAAAPHSFSAASHAAHPFTKTNTAANSRSPVDHNFINPLWRRASIEPAASTAVPAQRASLTSAHTLAPEQGNPFLSGLMTRLAEHAGLLAPKQEPLPLTASAWEWREQEAYENADKFFLASLPVVSFFASRGLPNAGVLTGLNALEKLFRASAPTTMIKETPKNSGSIPRDPALTPKQLEHEMHRAELSYDWPKVNQLNQELARRQMDHGLNVPPNSALLESGGGAFDLPPPKF